MIKTIMLSMCLAASSLSLDARAQADLVEFEKMTWVEVKSALAAGKTTALIYTGGTEQRGPPLPNRGHNLITHEVVEAIARKIPHAILLPLFAHPPDDAEAL